MPTLLHQLHAMHHFLLRQSFYPLVLSSALAITLLAARVHQSHSLMYVFLVWNLFLAWVPYAGSLWMLATWRRHPRDWWRLVVPGALWLIFFPNAPYIITDFIHLRPIAPVPLWYDIGLLASFAWAGCFLAVASLHGMQAIVKSSLGAVAGWLFVLAVVGLSGLGIYLGRFLRWNSWDLLLAPRGVLADVAAILADPLGQPRPLGVSCIFAAFLFVCYVTFAHVTPAPETANESQIYS